MSKKSVQEEVSVAPDGGKLVGAEDESPPVLAGYGYTRYLIVTSNPTYTGKVYGVPIANGIGILDPATLDPKLGHTMAGVVGELRQLPGYTITELVGDPMTAIRTVREDQAAKEAGEIAILKMLSDTNIASKVREYLETKG